MLMAAKKESWDTMRTCRMVGRDRAAMATGTMTMRAMMTRVARGFCWMRFQTATSWDSLFSSTSSPGSSSGTSTTPRARWSKYQAQSRSSLT